MAKKMQIIEVEQKHVDTEQLAKELKSISIQKALLEKRDKEIKATLTDSYFTSASKDNKGNSFFQTLGNDGKPLIIKREARTSISLNDELAMLFFAERGLLDSVTNSITIFDEEKIAQLVADGVITPDELESICDKKVSYAIKFVKAEEEDATIY